MGWLFGRKKKKIKAGSALHDDQTLSFNTNDGVDNIIKPDQFKAAAGLDMGFPENDNSNLGDIESPTVPSGSDILDGEDDAWGETSSSGMPNINAPSSGPKMLDPNAELPSNPRPVGNLGQRLTQDYKYLQVHQYKRILGELGELGSELSHLNGLSKSIDKAEYNEEKHFLRLKETMRKTHDKVLQADRILFSNNR